jgi:hypothetical protein
MTKAAMTHDSRPVDVSPSLIERAAEAYDFTAALRSGPHALRAFEEAPKPPVDAAEPEPETAKETAKETARADAAVVQSLVEIRPAFAARVVSAPIQARTFGRDGVYRTRLACRYARRRIPTGEAPVAASRGGYRQVYDSHGSHGPRLLGAAR